MHDFGNGCEVLPLAWIMSHLPSDTKQSLIKLIDEEGISPLKGLRTLAIETNSFFLKEIRNAVSAAENIAKSSLIAEGKFKQMLLEAPSYVISKCTED